MFLNFQFSYGSSHRCGHTFRHNIVYDSLTPDPTLAMPPPSTPAPRPPLFSSTLKSALRSPYTQNQLARTQLLSPENDLEEAISLQPMTTNRIVPLSIEPTSDQSAAVATVLIQMPKCTSEPRFPQGLGKSMSGSPLIRLNEGSRLVSKDGSSTTTPAKKERYKCDIIPVTVGGGNSQTLSFGCVLVNTSQIKSKHYIKQNKNLPAPSRTGQNLPHH